MSSRCEYCGEYYPSEMHLNKCKSLSLKMRNSNKGSEANLEELYLISKQREYKKRIIESRLFKTNKQ